MQRDENHSTERSALRGHNTKTITDVFPASSKKKEKELPGPFGERIVSPFLSQDSAKAWKFFQEQSSPPAITSVEIWGDYAASLYTVPGQPPIPDPLESCPQMCTFFTDEMVRKAIDRMKTRRSYDHEGLVAEHFIHAKDIFFFYEKDILH